MNPNYCDTVTIYNRLKSSDSPDKKEHWKKTVLKNCSYNSAMIRSPGGNQQTLLQMDSRPEYTVRIPKNNDYRLYHEWKQDQVGFTLSAGDLVIKGHCQEEIDPATNNITAVMRRYAPDAFIISKVVDNTKHLVDKHYRVGG